MLLYFFAANKNVWDNLKAASTDAVSAWRSCQVLQENKADPVLCFSRICAFELIHFLLQLHMVRQQTL